MTKDFSELKNKIIEKSVIYTPAFRDCLNTALLSLKQRDLKKLVEKDIHFYELDRWGEYLKLPGEAVCITQETVGLGPERGKCIILHEVGHVILNHRLAMSDQELRRNQDKEADDFATRLAPSCQRYFERDSVTNELRCRSD